MAVIAFLRNLDKIEIYKAGETTCNLKDTQENVFKTLALMSERTSRPGN
mgnify:CR=1 FL=1